MEMIRIPPGPGGYGTGVWLPVRSGRVVLSLTGREIHPVAIELAAMTESELVNGYARLPPDEQLLCVVLNGTASLLCGLYPQKKVPVINIHPGCYSGPLSVYITDTNTVTGVTLSQLTLAERGIFPDPPAVITSEPVIRDEPAPERRLNTLAGAEVRLMMRAGDLLSVLCDATRDAIQVALRDLIPFMALISLLMALAQDSGFGTLTGHLLAPLVSSIWGLLLLSVICSFPLISPLLGPGAAFTQLVGVIIGTQIGNGTLPPALALPALFAINVQVGCDFIPVGLATQGANPVTLACGVPAFLLSRQLTGPLAVFTGWICAAGLFT